MARRSQYNRGELKRLVNYLLLILALLAVFALWLRWREPSMIYYPDRAIAITPDKLGQRYEDVWLTTADGVRINGWYLPAAHSLPSSPFTLLFLHGNAGNISHRYEKFDIFRSLGADVFIIDYRGYGRSEGQPNEPGTYLDAQAAYDYLTGLVAASPARGARSQSAATEDPGPRAGLAATTGRALPPRSIVVYGESLGAAVAVELASKVPVGGLVIEEAFTSVGDVGQKIFPFLPVRWLVRNKYDSLSKIGRVNVPVLIFHSRNDEIFPMRHAERLFAAAREPKTLVELRGGHNDAFLTSAETYREALRKFFDKLSW